MFIAADTLVVADTALQVHVKIDQVDTINSVAKSLNVFVGADAAFGMITTSGYDADSTPTRRGCGGDCSVRGRRRVRDITSGDHADGAAEANIFHDIDVPFYGWVG